MAIMNTSKYPQRSSFISCATGGTSFNHTSFFNPSETTSSFSSTSSAGSSSPIINEPVTAFAEPVQRSGPIPRKRGRKRTRFADPGHIPRPMNSFIHFRREWVAAHRDTELAKGPKSLSKLAGEAWHSLSKAERDRYQGLAKETKKEHEEAYPDYKYEPKRKTSRAGGSVSGSQRSSSAERDPDWVPSILRRDASSSSRSSEISCLSTDESDAESLNTPYYSRGSSVDLSYTPDEEAPPRPFPLFASAPGMMPPPKDDRTPTQADFVYSIHNTSLPLDQQMVPTYPIEFGAASNAQDLALPQYSSPTLSQSSQPTYPYYHALPLQQVAQTLPSDSHLMLHSALATPLRGSESMAYYDQAQTSPDTTSNPTQWEQTNFHDSFYASALDNTTSQFITAPAAPYTDYCNMTNDRLSLGLPITPLTRMFFEQEMKNGSTPVETMEELQDAFIASIESNSPSSSSSPSPPPHSYWPEIVQEVYNAPSVWSVPSQ